jgi:catechol 2,3-dioxygenase-like lactoylglutathione lyase family enzyme
MAVDLYVSNIQVSSEFYKSLGFKVVKKEGNTAELRLEKATLFLEENSEAPSPASYPVGSVLILVPNVEHYWVLSQKLGIPSIQPIENRYYGLRDFTVAGPDGLGLRFATPIPELEA